MNNVEELTKALCKASGCHHLCSNTEGCVVEEEAKAILDKYELVPKQKELTSTLTNEEKVSEKLLINENKSNNFDVKSNNELFKQALVEGINRRFDKDMMKLDLFESIVWKELDDGATALDIDRTTENLYSIGYRKQSEWISVEDRLPEALEEVLVYAFWFNEWRIVKAFYSKLGENFYICDGLYHKSDVPVTHWMPLPEAPRMKGGEE